MDTKKLTPGVIIGVAVIAVVAYFAWRTTSQPAPAANQTMTVSTPSAEAIEQACTDAGYDGDFCKFLHKQSLVTKVAIQTLGNSQGSELKSTIMIDGSRSWLKAEGAINYEIISDNGTTYTKGGDTWWQSATATEQPLKIDEFTFKTPSPEALAAKSVTYEKQSQEDCQDRQCLKFAVTDPAAGTAPTFIWFDTQDYLMRKSRVDNNGAFNEQTFSYDNVTIPTPDPVKQLTENQYIVPGQSEPVEAPASNPTQ